MKTNTLWATHFSNLSDSSEIRVIKEPLIAALEASFNRQIISKQRESFCFPWLDEEQNGVSAVSNGLARDFVEQNFTVAFAGESVRAIAEPFNCSLCSHADDDEDVQANGLLSQCREYGRFALVFDTQSLDDLLAQERRAHFWVKLELAKVVYLKGLETLETSFPKLLKGAADFMSEVLEESSVRRAGFIEPFLQAATLLKHPGYHEEREVRIVAIPHSTQALADRGRETELRGWPPAKEVHTQTESQRKHFALFESLDTNLPIKRIIIGPGANQKEDIEFAKSLVSNRVQIMISETPFIG